jgi:isoleucyl-tRNA synthetase
MGLISKEIQVLQEQINQLDKEGSLEIVIAGNTVIYQ